MNVLKCLSVAAVLAAPLFLAGAPAQALTAHQYQAQGHGVYVSSKARGYGWAGHRRWHRHYWRRHHWHR